jgi:hypothetical protein
VSLSFGLDRESRQYGKTRNRVNATPNMPMNADSSAAGYPIR